MRYRCAYEGKHLNGYPLADLPNVLREAIVELKPEWQAQHGAHGRPVGG
jgi:hypothetical protein